MARNTVEHVEIAPKRVKLIDVAAGQIFRLAARLCEDGPWYMKLDGGAAVHNYTQLATGVVYGTSNGGVMTEPLIPGNIIQLTGS